jgi:hypothetical protein
MVHPFETASPFAQPSPRATTFDATTCGARIFLELAIFAFPQDCDTRRSPVNQQCKSIFLADFFIVFDVKRAENADLCFQSSKSVLSPRHFSCSPSGQPHSDRAIDPGMSVCLRRGQPAGAAAARNESGRFFLIDASIKSSLAHPWSRRCRKSEWSPCAAGR